MATICQLDRRRPRPAAKGEDDRLTLTAEPNIDRRVIAAPDRTHPRRSPVPFVAPERGTPGGLRDSRPEGPQSDGGVNRWLSAQARREAALTPAAHPPGKTQLANPGRFAAAVLVVDGAGRCPSRRRLLPGLCWLALNRLSLRCRSPIASIRTSTPGWASGFLMSGHEIGGALGVVVLTPRGFLAIAGIAVGMTVIAFHVMRPMA